MQARLLCWFVLLCLASETPLSFCNGCLAQRLPADTPEERIQNVIQQLETVVSNSKAWRQGDVLWKEETYFDSFDTPIKSLDKNVDPKKLGGVWKQISWNRFIFDYDHGRYCWLSRVDIEQTNFETARNRVDEVGYVVDQVNKRAYSRIFPQPRAEMDFSRIDAMPVGFPDLRLIGLGGNTSTHFESAEQVLGNLRHAAKDAQITQTDRQIATRIENHAQTVKNFDTGEMITAAHFCEHCFDPTSLMPIRSHAWGEVKDNANMGGPKNGPKTEFAWTENEGIYLPKVVKSTAFAQIPIYSAPQFGWKNSNIHFHWFSINTPIDEQIFDGSVLEKNDTFRNMLDPYKSKATMLIEVLEKNKPKVKSKNGK